MATNIWPVLGFFADPTNAPAESAYYNFDNNDNVLRGLRYLTQDQQKAERNALYWDQVFRDMQRGVSNNLIDLTPLTSRGRRAFANERMNISDILSDDYYTSAMNSARRLMGAARFGDDNTTAMGMKHRYNDADRALAEKMLIPILNVNLPMDDPAVREKALELFRSGAGLNETVAKTRQFLLDSTGSKDLEEYMSKRSDPLHSKLWRVLNSTTPAKMVGDVYGTGFANDGYYNGEGVSRYFQTPKTGLALASLGSMLKVPELAGYLLSGPNTPHRARAITKALKLPAGPWGSVAGLGMNAYTAVENLGDDDAIKRYALDQVMRGNDPFKFDAKDTAYDLAINGMALPYGQFVGPGSTTRLYSHLKYMASPEYRAKLQQMKKDMASELLATGRYVKDEQGRVLKRPDSLAEHLANRGGKAFSTYLMAGNKTVPLMLASMGIGGASAVAEGIAMRKDMNNGVLDDDFYHRMKADEVNWDAPKWVNNTASGLKRSLRYMTDWSTLAHDSVGGLIDAYKYKVQAPRKAKQISDKIEKAHKELDKERQRRGLKKSSHQLSEEKAKKTASEPINNNFPAADAAANAEAITKDSLNLKPKVRFAHFSRKAYDKFGNPGVAATTTLKAFKPTNMASILFGDGSSFVKDIEADKNAAGERYRASGFGYIPTTLTAPFNDDARAYHIQKKLHKKAKNFTEDYKIPLNMSKAALAVLLLGGGIKALKNRSDKKNREFTDAELALLRKEGLIQ